MSSGCPQVPAGSFLYVDTPAKVRELTARLGDSTQAALDTEADSLHHYYEKVCLLQVSVLGRHFIVDPLVGIDVTPVLDELARRRLILHGADYDLRMLRRVYGFESPEVFDTMLAAQLLGYERFSLAALVEKHWGVVLCKRGQKADWSRRPIPPDLLEYATDDMRYLEPLAAQLRGELDRLGRVSWHASACQALLAEVANGKRAPDPDRQWRIKGWYTLKSRHAQAILREVWHWREKEAKKADLPPFKIMPNEKLVALSAWGVGSDDFATVPKLPRNCVGPRLRALKEAVNRGRNLAERHWPSPLTSRQLPKRPPSDPLLGLLKKVRDTVATELGLSPGVVLPASSIEAIAAARPASLSEMAKVGGLQSWQTEVLGELFLQVLQGHHCESSATAQSRIATGTPDHPEQ